MACLELIGCKFILVQVHKGKNFLCACIGHIAKVEFLLVFPFLLALKAEREFVGNNNPNIVGFKALCFVDGGKGHYIASNVVGKEFIQLADYLADG